MREASNGSSSTGPDAGTGTGTGRRQRIWAIAAAAAWGVAAIYLTMASSQPRLPVLDLEATTGHLLLGILVGGSLLSLLRVTTPPSGSFVRRAAVAIIGSLAFLGLTEVLQNFSDTRRPELGDAAADALGVAIITTLLVTAFVLLPDRAVAIASGFSVVALSAAAAVLVSSAVLPPAFGPAAAWPVDGAIGCIERYEAFDPPRPADTSTSGPIDAEPALAVDLAADPERSTGRLPELVLEPSGSLETVDGVGVRFGDDTEDGLRSVGPATDLVDALVAAKAFTVEGWIRPDNLTQNGPTRLVSVSDGSKKEDVNVHLGIEDERLSFRLRTGCRPIWFRTGRLSTAATHVAAVFDRGDVVLYVDGRPIMAAELDDPALDGWDRTYPLLIGNERTLDRPFEGVAASIAFHDRALDAAEIGRLADGPIRDRLDGLDAAGG
ncbi:MAG: LamG domain-containing protein [Actinomycetota bacterium]